MRLRPAVADALRRHAIAVGGSDTPASLRERLNDRYLEDVRRLKARRKAGEIPAAEYAGHAEALKESYPLLGLPLELWVE